MKPKKEGVSRRKYSNVRQYREAERKWFLDLKMVNLSFSKMVEKNMNDVDLHCKCLLRK